MTSHRSERPVAPADPSADVMAWLEAQLRAQVIPIHPQVAMAEADVWDEWASNAIDGTEAAVLRTAARLARTEQSPEAVPPPAQEDPFVLSEDQTDSLLPGYRTLLSAIRSVGNERDDRDENVLIPWGNCLARLIRDHPDHVTLHRLAERWFTALRAQAARTPADTWTAGWAHEACRRASGLSGDPFVTAALHVIQRILTSSSGFRPLRDSVTGTLTINGLRETVAVAETVATPAGPQPYHAIRVLRSPDLAPTVGWPAQTTAYQLVAKIPQIGWEHHPNIEPFLKDLPSVVSSHVIGAASPGRPLLTAAGDRHASSPSVDVVFSSVGAPQFGDPFRGYAYVVTEMVKLTPIRTLPA